MYYLPAIVTSYRQQGVLRAWGDEDRPQPHVHRLIGLVGLHRQPAVSLDVV